MGKMHARLTHVAIMHIHTSMRPTPRCLVRLRLGRTGRLGIIQTETRLTHEAVIQVQTTYMGKIRTWLTIAATMHIHAWHVA